MAAATVAVCGGLLVECGGGVDRVVWWFDKI